MPTKLLERPVLSEPFITDELLRRADQAGMRIEYVNGLAIWEASPVILHQKVTDRIRSGMKAPLHKAGCECIHYPDIYILFPDGSIKRPDISIFCEDPPQQETMCETLPEVVIEIISKGYEKKDWEVSLPFYQLWNIPDIVIFDPSNGKVSHYHGGQTDEYASPVELTFACGCRTTI